MYGAYRSGGVVMVTDNYMVHRFTNWAGGNGSCRGYSSTSDSKTGRPKENCQQIRNKAVKASEKKKYYRVKIDCNFTDLDAVNQLNKHWSCD